MDLSNIELNRPYKPREICALLNRPMPNSTYQREKLYEDLSALFVWHKQGYSIVVDEIISDTPANVRKVRIEKKIPFTACISSLMAYVPHEFTDEELFTFVFGISFEEAIDVSSYNYSRELLKIFSYILTSKVYSKYHSAILEIKKNSEMHYAFVNSSTGEKVSTPELYDAWRELFTTKHTYSDYVFAKKKINANSIGNIEVRYILHSVTIRGGYDELETRTQIIKHLYDYILKKFYEKLTNKEEKAIAKKLVNEWCEDKFKIHFMGKRKESRDPNALKLTVPNVVRYRIDKYMKKHNLDKMSYDQICEALYGKEINDLANFEYDYKKPVRKELDGNTGEWMESVHQPKHDLPSILKARVRHSIITITGAFFAASRKKGEYIVHYNVRDEDDNVRSASEEEVIIIESFSGAMPNGFSNGKRMSMINHELKPFGVKYAPKEYSFAFSDVEDFSSHEKEVQKLLDSKLFSIVKREIKTVAKENREKINEIYEIWKCQYLNSNIAQ